MDKKHLVLKGHCCSEESYDAAAVGEFSLEALSGACHSGKHVGRGVFISCEKCYKYTMVVDDDVLTLLSKICAWMNIQLEITKE